LQKALSELKDTSIQELVTKELVIPMLKHLYMQFTPYVKYVVLFMVIFLLTFIMSIMTLCIIVFTIIA
jgi:hypothetical protein